MTEVFICDGVRTPIGRYGGGLSSVRADDRSPEMFDITMGWRFINK